MTKRKRRMRKKKKRKKSKNPLPSLPKDKENGNQKNSRKHMFNTQSVNSERKLIFTKVVFESLWRWPNKTDNLHE